VRRFTRPKAELWISRGVREKLQEKHHLEAWEVEQTIFEDPDRFVVRAGDLYAVYGRTFAGRYLLCLVRRLRMHEIPVQEREPSLTILRLVTAREMNETQRRRYQARRGR
jgi:hypothetical protein